MSRILRTGADAHGARAVEYHGFVFTQGLVAEGSDPDIIGQTRDLLAQLEALLEQHGTDSTRLLHVQIWLKRLGDLAAFDTVWSAWLPPGLAPSRAVVEGTPAGSGKLVQLSVTACK